MAGTQPIRAGRAFVELLAEDSKLRRGLERAQRMLSWFGERLRDLREFSADVFGVMASAIAKGAIREAANVLFKALRYQWTQGTTWLNTIWNLSLVGMLRSFNDFYVELLAAVRLLAASVGRILEGINLPFAKTVELIVGAVSTQLPEELIGDAPMRVVAEGALARILSAQRRLQEAEEAYEAAVAAAENAPELRSSTLGAGLDRLRDVMGADGGIKALGTFSAHAAADLGFRVEEKQLDELKGIRKSSHDLLREFRKGGLAFFE